MAHTNSTANYGLPQFLTTDKPAWLTDVNNAYLAIDTAMKNNADAASTADGKAGQAITDASAADTKATNAKNVADGAVSSLANAFSAASTYNVGDYVTYNNILYKCHTAITTAAAWDGTKWTAVKAADEIKTKAVASDTYTKAEVASLVSSAFTTANIKSITRVAATVTTGSSGNIITSVPNDGKHFVVSPFIQGADYVLVPWVSSTYNTYVFTARGSGSWATLNNTEIDIRYWIVETYNA